MSTRRAIGTVTYVKGNTVLAFGHPFYLAGETNMPMYVGYITHVMSTGSARFKLGMPYKRVGTLTKTAAHAVAGELGKDPHTIPFTVNYGDATRGPRRKLSFRLVNHPMLHRQDLGAPDGRRVARRHASGRRRLRTRHLHRHLPHHHRHPGHHPPAEIAPVACHIFLYALPNMLRCLPATIPYGPVAHQRRDVSISYNPEPQTAVIERVVPDRQVAHPGETVNLAVSYRPFGKPVETKTVAVTVPPYLHRIADAGGGHRRRRDGPLRKVLLTSPVYPEEGVRGVTRWLTAELPTMICSWRTSSPRRRWRCAGSCCRISRRR